MSGHVHGGRAGAHGLVLIGFMGCGKSTVGSLAARRLDLPFVDSDALIEQRQGAIAAIFERQGEDGFRRLERETVLDLLREQDERPAVLALGGGAVKDPDVRAALRAAAHVVWLAAPPDLLWARVAHDRRRPLAQDEAEFRRLFSERETLYREVADVTVDAGRPLDVVVDDVLAGLAMKG